MSASHSHNEKERTVPRKVQTLTARVVLALSYHSRGTMKVLGRMIAYRGIGKGSVCYWTEGERENSYYGETAGRNKERSMEGNVVCACQGGKS